MKFSLGFKVLAITLIILAVSQVLGTLLVIASFQRDYTETIQGKFAVLGRNLRQTIEDSFLFLGVPLGQLDGLNELLEDIVDNNREISFIAITDAKGKMLFHIDPGEANLDRTSLPKVEGDFSSLQGTEPRQVTTLLIEGQYNTLVPLFDEDDGHVGNIHLSFPATIVSEKVRGMVRSSLIVMSVSLLTASGLLVLFISLGVTRPVSRLVGAMEEIIKDRDLTRRVTVASADEVGDLANRFNEFVGNIEGVVKQLATTPNAISASAEELRRALAENSSNVDLVSKTIEDLRSDVDRDMDRIVMLIGSINEINVWSKTITHSVREIHGRMAKALTVIGQAEPASGKTLDEDTTLMETWDLTGLFNSTEELGKKVESINCGIDELIPNSLERPTAGAALSEELERARVHGSELASKVKELYGLIHTSVNEFVMDRSLGILKIRETKTVRGDLARTSRIAEDVRQKLSDLLSDLEKRASDLVQESQRMIEDLSEVIEAIVEDYKGVRNISSIIAEERKALSEVSPALESFRARFEKLKGETKEFKIGS